MHGFQNSGAGFDCNVNNTDQNLPTPEIVRYKDVASNPPPSPVKYWEDMPGWLEEDYDVWVAKYNTGDSGTPIIENNSICLKNQINYLYNKLYSESTETRQDIILVGHSTGGLVSRACLTDPDCGNKVKALITLGTPHVGIPGSDIRMDIGCNILDNHPAICEMFEDEMRDGSFNIRNQNRSDMSYVFLGGGPEPMIISNWLFPVPFWDGRFWDGLVGKYSAVGWEWPSGEYTFAWTHWSPPVQLWTDEYHSKSLAQAIPGIGVPVRNFYYYRRLDKFTSVPTGEKSHAYECLTTWLESNTNEDFWNTKPDFCEKAEASSFLSVLDTSSPSQKTELQQDTLINGQTATPALQIDTSNASRFNLVWENGTLDFTLTRPGGQVINPTYAASHPEEVDYKVTLGGNEFLSSATYSFTSTTPGQWQLNITASNVDSAGTGYVAFAELETSRTLDVTSNLDHYNIGQTAIFTTTLQHDSAGLSGDTVTVNLTRSDNTANNITLVDQGNGIYVGTYTIPDSPGYLRAAILANGDDNGTPFTRQANLLLTIAPNDAQLTGTYADQPHDDNSDGLYETLDIFIGISAIETGSYHLTAELEANGQPVAFSGRYISLTPGTQTVTLQFDGDDIRAARLDGPYTLTRLYLFKTDVGVTAQSAENVWTTAAYKYSQFGSSFEKTYLPIIIK